MVTCMVAKYIGILYEMSIDCAAASNKSVRGTYMSDTI